MRVCFTNRGIVINPTGGDVLCESGSVSTAAIGVNSVPRGSIVKYSKLLVYKLKMERIYIRWQILKRFGNIFDQLIL